MINHIILKNRTSFSVVKQTFDVEFVQTVSSGYHFVDEEHTLIDEKVLFEGSISDCYAYIKVIKESLLKE